MRLMRYAVISDIHANATALRLVLKDAAAAGVDQVVCLGDVVGYGPEPREALALVRRFASVVIAGNHDDAVSGRISADDFIDLAGDAVRRHRATLNAEQIDWLKSLPHVARLEGALAAHGDFTAPKDFPYVSDEADAAANFAATDSPLLFVGHTHVPLVFVVGASGTVHRLKPCDFALEAGKRYIVNPGSVGYPREEDGVCQSSYVIYDSSARTVRFRFLPFSVASVMQRGGEPRRIRKRTVFAALALAAGIAGGVASYVLAPRPDPVRVEVTRTLPEIDPSLVLTNRVLTLGHDMKSVRANLKLKREKLGPVQLKVVFRNANNEEIGGWQDAVRLSSSKAIQIPPNGLTAEFTVYRMRPEDPPRTILSFNPKASAK